MQTIGQHFRASGYYTAGAGKIFHYRQVDATGWDDYYPSITEPMPQENASYSSMYARLKSPAYIQWSCPAAWRYPPIKCSPSKT